MTDDEKDRRIAEHLEISVDEYRRRRDELLRQCEELRKEGER